MLASAAPVWDATQGLPTVLDDALPDLDLPLLEELLGDMEGSSSHAGPARQTQSEPVPSPATSPAQALPSAAPVAEQAPSMAGEPESGTARRRLQERQRREHMQRISKRQKAVHLKEREWAGLAQQLHSENQELKAQMRFSGLPRPSALDRNVTWSTSSASEWAPEDGWATFTPSCTLVLRLTPNPGTIIRLTQAQLRALTLDQFRCITECWVSVTAPLLPAATADPLGKEARQIGLLKEGVCAFCCSIAANNPNLFQAVSRRDMDACEQEAANGLVPRQLAAADLTTEQSAYIHDLYEATFAQQQRLQQERLQLLGCLQALTTTDQTAGRAASTTHAESAACLKRLQANNVEAGVLAISFVGHLWDYATSPLQMCVIMHQAANCKGREAPMLPNAWAMARALKPCQPSVARARLISERSKQYTQWHTLLSAQAVVC